jgi:glycosyltransferase involved in cell wall biosynthesis
MHPSVAVVAIGRNEGLRLTRCLNSIRGRVDHVVYVDSGSTDGSVERARELGADVVVLDSSRPFTAARGRNAGWARLLELLPSLELVQFIDGDCELQPGWIEAGSAYLEANAAVAAVAGRRRERNPEASPYNRLADMEWDTPVGETAAFGGDVMLRTSVLHEVEGYDESLIAGEDPDLSFRIRRAGGRLVRLDEEMTLHDADMHHFGEFWRRQVRGGHAYAERLWLHGIAADPAIARSVISIAAWAGLLPAMTAALAWPTSGLSLGLLALYPLLWLKIFRAKRKQGKAARDSALYASACIIGKFAELRGTILYAWVRFFRRKHSVLLEYKGPESRATGQSTAREPVDSSSSGPG